MSGPRVLDLFCGAGGAAMGYHRAWPDADITGVDIRPMPRYPFRFIPSDAMTFDLSGYDFIHASPPCQGYSSTRHIRGRDMSSYPKLLDALRTQLQDQQAPWVIENVSGATFRSGVTLCGQMFGLRVFRHRSFEASWLLLSPDHPRHAEKINQPTNGRTLAYYTREPGRMVTVAGHLFSMAAGSAAMGIDWMRKDELAEAIPPAYTTWLAQQYGPLQAPGAGRMTSLLIVPRGGRGAERGAVHRGID